MSILSVLGYFVHVFYFYAYYLDTTAPAAEILNMLRKFDQEIGQPRW